MQTTLKQFLVVVLLLMFSCDSQLSKLLTVINGHGMNLLWLINPSLWNHHPLFSSSLPSLPLYLCMCCISRVNMPAAIESLKVIYGPCRDGVGLRCWGLNVIRSLASEARPWPEGRSQGLMKTNPSLCCPGNRSESWRASGVQRSVRV